MTHEHEPPQPKFELGQLVGTPGAREAFQRNGQEPFDFLFRHATGDWGDLEDEDKQENDFSVDKELRILRACKRITPHFSNRCHVHAARGRIV
jgi:hypothetical protein